MRSERRGGSLLKARDRQGVEKPIVKMDDFQLKEWRTLVDDFRTAIVSWSLLH